MWIGILTSEINTTAIGVIASWSDGPRRGQTACLLLRDPSFRATGGEWRKGFDSARKNSSAPILHGYVQPVHPISTRDVIDLMVSLDYLVFYYLYGRVFLPVEFRRITRTLTISRKFITCKAEIHNYVRV